MRNMFINTIAAMKSDSAYIAIHRTLGVNAARIRAERVEWLCKLADGLDVPMVEFFSGLESSAPGKIGKFDRGEAEK